MSICRLASTILIWSVVAAMPGAALAEGSHCRLALVLALDASSSIDAAEDRLQRQGFASALRAPDVAAAFLGSPGSVALHAFEFSGSHHQATMLGWTPINTRADLEFAAGIIGASTRQRNDLPTGIGTALGHAATELSRGPDCLRHKVDVSGDGVSNDGYPPASAYKSFGYHEITVNGLAILGGPENGADLIDYFEAEVLHGPGAFLEIATDSEDFARAIRRKLIREVSDEMLSEAERSDPLR